MRRSGSSPGNAIPNIGLPEGCRSNDGEGGGKAQQLAGCLTEGLMIQFLEEMVGPTAITLVAP